MASIGISQSGASPADHAPRSNGLVFYVMFLMTVVVASAYLGAYVRHSNVAFLWSAGSAAASAALFYGCGLAWRRRGRVREEREPEVTLAQYVVDIMEQTERLLDTISIEFLLEKKLDREAVGSLGQVAGWVGLPYPDSWLHPLVDALGAKGNERLAEKWAERARILADFNANVSRKLLDLQSTTAMTPDERLEEKLQLWRTCSMLRDQAESLASETECLVYEMKTPFLFVPPADVELPDPLALFTELCDLSGEALDRKPQIDATELCILSRKLHVLAAARLWPLMYIDEVREIKCHLERFYDAMEAVDDEEGGIYRRNVGRRLRRIRHLLAVEPPLLAAVAARRVA